jgi:16S rRNA processing protein RimM
VTFVAVGRIARAHGIRGEVAVQPLTEVESRFSPGSVLGLEDGRKLTVAASRPHQNRLLVRFKEIADRNAAEALRGEVLVVPASDSPTIADDDRFWVREIVGLEVVTGDGRVVGRIRDVLGNPANDVWVVDAGGRDVLIPAIRDVVVEVDRDAGRVVINELPGLLDR